MTTTRWRTQMKEGAKARTQAGMRTQTRARTRSHSLPASHASGRDVSSALKHSTVTTKAVMEQSHGAFEEVRGVLNQAIVAIRPGSPSPQRAHSARRSRRSRRSPLSDDGAHHHGSHHGNPVTSCENCAALQKEVERLRQAERDRDIDIHRQVIDRVHEGLRERERETGLFAETQHFGETLDQTQRLHSDLQVG